MTINPSKLRTCIEQGAKALIVDAADMPMLADALEIADSCARADIESYCTAETPNPSDYPYWWNTASADEDDSAAVEQALRYLTARELIERHPTDAALVRFVQGAS